MSDVFLYADETGNLDYDVGNKQGATTYFGFGTACFVGNHGEALFEGMKLRAHLEREGLSLGQGFHAVNDSIHTRNEMFRLIAQQAPRFDSTFLLKENAYPAVRAQGQMRLYKMAWYLHFKEIARRVTEPDDHLYVIAGAFGTKERQSSARLALQEVCNQVDRDITLCVWQSATSWGLQVADYGLWGVQRVLEGKRCTWYEPCIEPTLRSTFLPWGST